MYEPTPEELMQQQQQEQQLQGDALESNEGNTGNNYIIGNFNKHNH
jgi:hypothetical protein